MTNELSIGHPLPELNLLTAEGTATTVGAQLGSKRTLLYFLHGTWCPECVGELHLLQRYQPGITAASADIIAIVSDDPETLNTFLISVAPSVAYKVLADPKHTAYQKVGASDDTLAVIVDGGGIVRWLARWADHRGEPGQGTILQALREIPDA
jgi:peroxiredoxin